jgi:hypothetical protein
MASYFRQVPNFDYISRDADSQSISDYVQVKNLFKRGRLREDIFGNLSIFTKYKIIGDERPDNVAFKTYKDETLDWVVLLSNNILNIQTEWPLTNDAFDKVMLEKYGTYENLNSTHHFETIEVKNSLGIKIIPEGLQVPEKIIDYRQILPDGDENPTYETLVPYFIEFYDSGTGQLSYKTDITVEITNYEYEMRIQEERRNIFLLKPQYLNVVFNDMDEIMPYKKGGAQYVSPTLKKGDDIRLYT